MTTDNSWIYTIQTDIFTILAQKIKTRLLSDYPNLSVTMDDTTPTEPKFPTVYIHFLQGIEQANNLVNQEVNAVLQTMQYEITVSKEQGLIGVRKVTECVTSALKDLQFTLVATPEIMNTNPDTKRMVGRARRMLTSGTTWD